MSEKRKEEKRVNLEYVHGHNFICRPRMRRVVYKALTDNGLDRDIWKEYRNRFDEALRICSFFPIYAWFMVSIVEGGVLAVLGYYLLTRSAAGVTFWIILVILFTLLNLVILSAQRSRTLRASKRIANILLDLNKEAPDGMRFELPVPSISGVLATAVIQLGSVKRT